MWSTHLKGYRCGSIKTETGHPCINKPNTSAHRKYIHNTDVNTERNTTGREWEPERPLKILYTSNKCRKLTQGK
ncbi:hypothetical protein Bpfe_029675, partial [Biomphalaria pfeifferi]